MADNFKIKLCDFGLATYFDSPRDKRTVGSEVKPFLKAFLF